MVGSRFTRSLFLPLAAACAIALSASLVHFYRTQLTLIRGQELRELRVVDDLVANELGATQTLLSAVAEVVLQNDTIMTPFAIHDRSSLLSQGQGLLAGLQMKHGISHLYFVLPDRTVFLRIHEPDRGGDTIDRFTTLEAERTGRLAAGLEVGPLGTLTLRVVAPYHRDGELIGFLELGKNFDRIAISVHEILGVPLAVFVNKAYLSRPTWVYYRERRGLDADWNALDSTVLTHCASAADASGISDLMREMLKTPELQTNWTRRDNRDLGVHRLPIHDVEGREIASVVVARDITKATTTARESIVRVGAIYLLVTGLLLTVLMVVILRVDRRIQAELLQRRASEEALRRSEARLVAAQRIARLGDWCWTIETDSLIASDQACAILGLSTAVMSLDAIVRATHPDDQTAFRAAIDRAIERKGAFNIDHRIVDPNGTIRYVTEQGLVTLDDDGAPRHVVGTIQDISDRTKGDVALCESQDRLRNIIDSTSTFMVLTALDGKLLDVNRALLDALGLRPEDVLGRPIDALPCWSASPLTAVRLRDSLRRAAHGGTARLDADIQLRDQITAALEVNFGPLCDRHGNVLQVVVSATDVTERKRAERDLDRSNRILQTFSRAQSQFIADANPYELFRNLLSNLLWLTDSAYGFIAEVVDVRERQERLRPYAAGQLGPAGESTWVSAIDSFDDIELAETDSLLSEVVVRHRAVILNDLANEPRPSGLPSGHPELASAVGLPIDLGGELTSVVVIGNRYGGYDAALIASLEPVLIACGHIVDTFRSNRQRRKTQEALH